MHEHAPDPEALLDAGDVDGLLATFSLDDIAAAWCRNADENRAAGQEPGPDFWAWLLLCDSYVWRRHELLRALLVRIVKLASDQALGLAGAGPVEDFLSDDEDDLQWIERECDRSERFVEPCVAPCGPKLRPRSGGCLLTQT